MYLIESLILYAETLIHLGPRNLHFFFFASGTDSLWTPRRRSPGWTNFHTVLRCIKNKGWEGGTGFFLFLRPHLSGHASVLNATPTFALIPVFSCSVSFLLILNIHLLFIPSLFCTLLPSLIHILNTVLEIKSTHLFRFHLLAQGW